jgi:hypothetical protein
MLIFANLISDKHPQLNEFLTQIKNTPDLANLFESIQKDTNTGVDAFGLAMDMSWRDGRREAGHGEANSSTRGGSINKNKRPIAGQTQIENGSSSARKSAKVNHWNINNNKQQQNIKITIHSGFNHL